MHNGYPLCVVWMVFYIRLLLYIADLPSGVSVDMIWSEVSAMSYNIIANTVNLYMV